MIDDQITSPSRNDSVPPTDTQGRSIDVALTLKCSGHGSPKRHPSLQRLHALSHRLDLDIDRAECLSQALLDIAQNDNHGRNVDGGWGEE